MPVTSGKGATQATAALEQQIDQALATGAWNQATRLILEGYGPEIGSLLWSMHRDGTADEVFSLFAEGVWRSLASFERKCSARTWAYVIAHRVSSQHRRQAKRRSARFVPIEDSMLAQVEAKVRTETLSFLQTETRSKLVALREQLPPADQLLLVLRVDRKLSWDDLALVMNEGLAAPLEGEALKRESARLRKRFQLVKDKIRALAREAGLVGEPSEHGSS